MEQVENLKSQGNKAFSAKEYQKAITYYTDAIEIDPNNHTLYSNRSGSYCALGKYEQAIFDAKKVIELKPDWVRGYTRLGAAFQGQQDWTAAAKAFTQALEIDPSNQGARSDLSEVNRQKTVEESQDEIAISTFSHLFTEESLKTASLTNPKLASLLEDPSSRDILSQIRENPDSIGRFSTNSTFMQILTAILTGNTEDGNTIMNQTTSEEEKLLGNEAFKSGKFDEALEHYNKAIEMDEFNVIYYNNKATVYSKQGRFEEAVKICEEAIKKGKEHGAAPEAIARSYQKIASAQSSLGRLDLAIEALKASLKEKKDAQVQIELKKVEAAYEKKKKSDYENPELAEKAKIEGNRFYSKGEFSKAIDCYTEAIKRAPKNAILYTNRAAAYTKLQETMMAIADCIKAIEIDPKYPKAYTRKAYCHFTMKDFDNARSLYNQALKLDPNNAEAIEGLKAVDKYTKDKKK